MKTSSFLLTAVLANVGLALGSRSTCFTGKIVETDDSGIFVPPSRREEEEGRPGQSLIWADNILSCSRRCETTGDSQGSCWYLPRDKIQCFYTLTIKGSGALTLGGAGGIGMASVLGGTGCYKDATGFVPIDTDTDEEGTFLFTYDLSQVNVN